MRIQPVQPAEKGQVLILAFYFPPHTATGAQRPGRFVRYLPEFGYSSQVITGNEAGSKNGPAVCCLPDRSIHGTGPAMLSTAAGLLQRVISPHNDRLYWVPHAVAQAEKYLAAHPVSAILTTSPPIATHVAGLWLKKRHPRLKWIADFRDPLMLKGVQFRTARLTKYADRWLERAIFQHADALTTVTDVILEDWHER